jgi:hypothetical protein
MTSSVPPRAAPELGIPRVPSGTGSGRAPRARRLVARTWRAAVAGPGVPAPADRMSRPPAVKWSSTATPPRGGRTGGWPGPWRRQSRGEDALELPDVAGPVVGLQEREGLRADGLRLGGGIRQTSEEVVDQQSDVAPPVAEGRHLDWHHVQPVEQVFPELAGGHRLLERLVGRGDDPDVDLHRLVSATARTYRSGAPGGVGRVARDMSPISSRKIVPAHAGLPDALSGGSRERALLVAEQLGFQEVLRDRRAVDGEEGRWDRWLLWVDRTTAAPCPCRFPR